MPHILKHISCETESVTELLYKNANIDKVEKSGKLLCRIVLIMLLFVLCFCASCGHKEARYALDMAEKRMWDEPDSALKVLESIVMPEDLEGKELADYALLLTQAQYRSNIVATSDSLINIAVGYYQDKDVEKRTASLLYKGGVLKDMGKDEEAMFVLTLFVFITLAMWGSAMNYYFENYVDAGALYAFLDKLGLVATEAQDSIGYSILNAFGLIVSSPDKAYEVGFGVFNMLGALVQFFGVILLSEYLANKYGKKQTFIVCLTLTAIFTAMFYFPAKDNIGFMFVLNFLKSLAYAPTVPLLWAMIADVADHSEYVHYRRATGFVFAGVVFALKAGLGVGGAILGFLLSGFGYISGAGVAQSDSAIHGIILSSSLIPAATFFVGVIALFFYPITKKYNEKMQAELAERRSKNDY